MGIGLRPDYNRAFSTLLTPTCFRISPGDAYSLRDADSRPSPSTGAPVLARGQLAPRSQTSIGVAGGSGPGGRWHLRLSASLYRGAAGAARPGRARPAWQRGRDRQRDGKRGGYQAGQAHVHGLGQDQRHPGQHWRPGQREPGAGSPRQRRGTGQAGNRQEPTAHGAAQAAAIDRDRHTGRPGGASTAARPTWI